MNRKNNLIILLAALFLYIPLGLLQVKIDYRRTLEDLEGRLLLMPGQVAGNLVLSGFRGIAADLLWLNVEDFWHKGQHYKMLPLLDSVSWLQPQYITVWAIGGWHMTYNIFANVGGKSSEIETGLKEFRDAHEELQNALKPVEKIAKEVLELMEGFDSYTGQGMAEKDIPGIIARLDGYEAALEELQKNTEIQPAVEIAGNLAAIAKEKLFWYQKGTAFLKKGITYNREKYDIYFELGWTYFHKAKDYPNAARYLEKAAKFPHPSYVDNVLAHAYELNGEVDKALAQWEKQMESGGFNNVAERAVRLIKTEGAFNPRRRRMLGLDED
ncbi:MAG: hypothetical protein JW957_06815 [Candidatus Omnitrophica bacterium]|nr:hypothetical protein [Candidatus Omnitrophota bacterium]